MKFIISKHPYIKFATYTEDQLSDAVKLAAKEMGYSYIPNKYPILVTQTGYPVIVEIQGETISFHSSESDMLTSGRGSCFPDFKAIALMIYAMANPQNMFLAVEDVS